VSVHQELWDQEDHLDLQENLEVLVRMDLLEDLELFGETPLSLVNLEFKSSVQLCLDQKVRLVHQECLENLGRLDK